MKCLIIFLSISSLLVLARGDFNESVDKIVRTINQEAVKDKKAKIENSKFMSKGFQQLNAEFVNPYNQSKNPLGLEESVAKRLKSDELTNCEMTKRTYFSIRERADYFSNQIANRRPYGMVTCPIQVPLIQREHELVMGFLLNSLRSNILLAKRCSDGLEVKERIARVLGPVRKNRFVDNGDIIKTCKVTKESIGNSCLYTGMLQAGPGEIINGLRLRKVNNKIIPEIQVAKVTLFGLVDLSTQKWIGPDRQSQNQCSPINNLQATKPVKFRQGQKSVLTKLKLMSTDRRDISVLGNKLNFWTGKLGANQIPAKLSGTIISIKDAKYIDTEPVYVPTTVAGAGLNYDVETKTISPVLVAKNIVERFD